MIKPLTITVLLLLANWIAIAQSRNVTKSEFRSEMSRMAGEMSSIRDVDAELQRTISAQKKQVDSLSNQLAESQAKIKKLADSTNVTISEISSENKNTQSRLQEIDQTISKRTLYWAIIILILSLLGISSFVLVRKRLSSNTQNFDSEIAATKEALEKLQTGANEHDSDLAEVLQTQLALLKEKKLSGGPNDAQINHALPLKVGDEIHRMRKRIENMPQEIKGLGALRNSLTRLEEEFNENGYSIDDLLGRKFDPGMNIRAICRRRQRSQGERDNYRGFATADYVQRKSCPAREGRSRKILLNFTINYGTRKN